MQLSFKLQDFVATRSLRWIALVSATAVSAAADAKPSVEFDFARAAECRDVTSPERAGQYPHQRIVEVTLPVSVRFRGVAMEDVDELDIEVNGAAAGLQVFDFAPDTQLASDVDSTIETTTTVKKARSFDATLGGQLPVPYAEIVAHVTPSINAGASRGEVATEKMNRLPPKYAVVVSGTSSAGRGVFFKLKRSSQTSLEGVHELVVQFIAPADWRGGKLLVGCTARGTRKMLWLDQEATLGGAANEVQLYVASRGGPRSPLRHTVAKQPTTTVASRPNNTNSAAANTTSKAPTASPVNSEHEAVHKEVRGKVTDLGS
jgi:hypothetical protein